MHAMLAIATLKNYGPLGSFMAHRSFYRLQRLSRVLLVVALGLAATVRAATITNLALAGTASMSSVGYGTTAARANDGNTSGLWVDNSIAHSAEPTAEDVRFWEVDLGSAQAIGRVNVWFRTDCCPERGADFTVRILAADRTDLWNRTYSGTPPANVAYNLPSAVPGRFVRWEPGTLPHTTFHLAEVQAFAPYTGASLVVAASPASQTVLEGATATLGPVSAAVNNGPADELSLLWLRNGVEIPGATDFTLTTPP